MEGAVSDYKGFLGAGQDIKRIKTVKESVWAVFTLFVDLSGTGRGLLFGDCGIRGVCIHE